MKKGRFSVSEQQFITQNCEKMTYEQIGDALDRDPISIKQYVEDKLGKNLPAKKAALVQAKLDIKSRPYWAELKKQFTESELELFIYHWGLIYDQFKEDVFYTEELQILEVVKLEILMNRTLNKERDFLDRVENLRQLVEDEKAKPDTTKDPAKIIQLESQIAAAYAGHEALSKEYRELLNRKQAFLKDIKGSRSDRVKDLENSRESIIGWFRDMLGNNEKRKEVGLKIEKVRMAMELERNRLSQYYKYLDGTVDQPFLTSETVKEDNNVQ